MYELHFDAEDEVKCGANQVDPRDETNNDMTYNKGKTAAYNISQYLVIEKMQKRM